MAGTSSNRHLDEKPYRLLFALADSSHRSGHHAGRPVLDCTSTCPACVELAGLVPDDEAYVLAHPDTGDVLTYGPAVDRWIGDDGLGRSVEELDGLGFVPVLAARLGIDVTELPSWTGAA